MNSFLNNIYRHIKFKRRGYSINPDEIFSNLMISQYWPINRIKQLQLDRLNKLLKIAKNSSSYYKEILKHINLPLNSLEQFQNEIPILERKQIVTNYDELKTERFTKRFAHSTSGTTGEPMTIFTSDISEIYSIASHLRFHSWWGIKRNDKSIYIGRKNSLSEDSWLNRLKFFLRNRLDIDVFELTDDNIVEIFNNIKQFKPAYIRGYKSGILELAQLMDKKNLSFRDLNFKVAIVTAEVLYENERKFISKILKCDVANEYGSVEAGCYAYECPMGSLHINEESVYIYTNENNETIVTEFANDSMPLINYKNNDIVLISNKFCECGRTSRIIEKVEGRVSDKILLEDGTQINQLIIPIIFRKFYEDKFKNMIRKYSVIQKRNKFTVKIVPLENYNSECEEYIERKMREEISDNIEIKFELVAEIERDRSGKFSIFKREK